MPRGRVKEEGQRGRLGFEGRKLGGEGYCPRCTVLSSYLGGSQGTGCRDGKFSKPCTC